MYASMLSCNMLAAKCYQFTLLVLRVRLPLCTAECEAPNLPGLPWTIAGAFQPSDAS